MNTLNQQKLALLPKEAALPTTHTSPWCWHSHLCCCPGSLIRELTQIKKAIFSWMSFHLDPFSDQACKQKIHFILKVKSTYVWRGWDIFFIINCKLSTKLWNFWYFADFAICLWKVGCWKCVHLNSLHSKNVVTKVDDKTRYRSITLPSYARNILWRLTLYGTI